MAHDVVSTIWDSIIDYEEVSLEHTIDRGSFPTFHDPVLYHGPCSLTWRGKREKSAPKDT